MNPRNLIVFVGSLSRAKQLALLSGAFIVILMLAGLLVSVAVQKKNPITGNPITPPSVNEIIRNITPGSQQEDDSGGQADENGDTAPSPSPDGTASPQPHGSTNSSGNSTGSSGGGGNTNNNGGNGNNEDGSDGDSGDDDEAEEDSSFVWPSPSNTGPRSVPAKTYNNEFGGDYGAEAYRITTEGAVIEGFTINRCVVIFANNVTLRDNIINCAHNIAAVWPNGAQNTTIEYNEINGMPLTNPSAAGLICSNTCTAKRNKISGTADGIKAGSNSTVIENYIGQLRGGETGTGGTHNDGMQIEGTISNVLIKDNVIEHNCNSQSSGACNSAIWIQGTVSNLTLDHNYFKQWQSYFVVRGNGSNVTNIKVINNLFNSDSVSGTKIAFTSGATASLVACNIQTNGAIITSAGNTNNSCPAS